MDKKMMDALNNLSLSIDELITSIKDEKKQDLEANKSVGKNGFFGGKITKTINIIRKDINTIKKDIKDIIKNQSNILNTLKKTNRKGNVIDGLVDDKNKRRRLNLKDGIGTIGLMAGSILLLGKAFGIIGNVDFASVLALSISLPLLAMAFEKIAQIKSLTPTTIGKVLSVVVGMSAAILLSSLILNKVAPISLAQIGSILATGTALGIATYLMTPILTSRNFGKITPKQILTLPILLVGIAAAIVASSWVYQKFTPLNNDILLSIITSSIVIGIAATALSIPITLLSLAISKVGFGNFILGNVGMIMIAGSFTLASLLVSYGDFSKEIPMSYAISFSIAMALLAVPVAILGYISPSIVAMGSVGLVMVAAAFAASSWLLRFADFTFINKMADAMAYAIGVMAKTVVPLLPEIGTALGKFIYNLASNVLPLLMPLAQGIAYFINAIEPPITRFIQGVFPLITDLIINMLPILMPMIKSVMDIIMGVVNLIPNTLNGISNIIDTITNSIVKLSNVSGTSLISVGLGLGSVAVGLAAMTAGGIVNSIGSLFGANSFTSQLKEISTYSKDVFLAGKGIQYLATSLERLSTDAIDTKKINSALKSLNSVSMSELAKNAGTVVTISPKDLKNAFDEEDAEIKVLPTNTNSSESSSVTQVQQNSSTSNTELLLTQMLSSQSQTNSLLQEISNNSKSFNKMYNEIVKNKTIKTKDKK